MIVLSAAWALASNYWTALEVCESKFTAAGVTRTCHPVGPDELAPTGLAVGLLLLPETAELVIAGVSVKLRRREKTDSRSGGEQASAGEGGDDG